MSDFGMQQLFEDKNYLGPTMLSAERWGIEQERKKADLAKLVQETQQTAELHPYKLESERLGNEGKVAANRKAVTEASLGEATLPSKIAKEVSDNEYAVLGNKIKSYDASIGMLDQAVPMLSRVPPAARHAALISAAKQMGIDPNNPQMAPLMQSLAQVPGEQLPAALEQFKTRLVERSAAYKQAMDVAKLQRDSVEREGKANRANQLAVANVNATSREKVAAARQQANKNVNDQLASAKTSDARISVYEAASQKARESGDDALADDYAAKANLERQARLTERGAVIDAKTRADLDRLRALGFDIKEPAAKPNKTKSGATYTIEETK